ncbi:MAG: RdgB/HAM1 family non-canonical purine NTP pyrophosphatase [Alphaproteobacteria bacterium]|nr:RdgB/HAM1 family non-canonical purine NTP pyrophosphatase [Alphaproteobacteria bacterium SS10]
MSETPRATPRLFDGDTLVIATHNKGKVPEIAALLEGRVPHMTSAGELGLDVPEETGTTFMANATIKALAAASASGKPALADDSGLSVAALDGAPGVYTADWAEEGPDGEKLPARDWVMAMTKVHDRMQASGNADKSAAFISALALAWPDGHVEVVEGRCEGSITWPMRGEKGFGYDPVFIPDGYEVTFAEMDPTEKQAISHRANAFALLRERCFPG